jgi:hypothetical protein
MPLSTAQQAMKVIPSALMVNTILQVVAYCCGGGKMHLLAAAASGVHYISLLHACGNIFGNTRTERYFDLTGAVTQCVVVGLALLDWSGTPRAGLSLRQQLLAAMVLVGLGRIVALCYRSSASCQIH